jgi:hypothetical protein
MGVKTFSVVVSMLVVLAIVFSLGRRIILIAENDISVVDFPDAGRVVGIIHKGEIVNVSECEDLKHYIAPKVHLSNGVDGYVLKGDFYLVRRSAWYFSGGMLSYSCS